VQSFGVYYTSAFFGGFAAAAVVTVAVVALFGRAAGLVTVVTVPLLSWPAVWPVAASLGPNSGCNYDCEGNALFGILLYAGVVLGVVVAAAATWVVGLGDEYPKGRGELPELPRGYGARHESDESD
jgi:hypothetical protein